MMILLTMPMILYATRAMTTVLARRRVEEISATRQLCEKRSSVRLLPASQPTNQRGLTLTVQKARETRKSGGIREDGGRRGR